MLKPKLDYLMQYPVKEVRSYDDSEEGGAYWEIEFENGATIINHDSSKPVPEFSAPGVALLNVIYSNDETRCIFGRSTPTGEIVGQTEVVLNPTEYAISDPRFEGTLFPQRLSPLDEQAEAVATAALPQEAEDWEPEPSVAEVEMSEEKEPSAPGQEG